MTSQSRSSESFSIRRATADDSAAILECLSLAFEPFRESYSEKGFLDTILTPETVTNRLREMLVFVAVWEGSVIGTIGCRTVNQHEGHLRGMAVLPDRQGSSVATALLAHAEQELLNAGCSAITLNTTEPLKRAMRFYEKHGYRATGRVGDFFGMPLFQYRKQLGTKPESSNTAAE